jgi:hypothetical protein
MNLNTLARLLSNVRRDARVVDFRFFFDATAGQQEVAVGRIWQVEIAHDGATYSVVGSLQVTTAGGYPGARATSAWANGSALPTSQAALASILQEIATVHIDSYVDWALDGSIDEEAARE